MAKITGIRGVLLEEALLHLLRGVGYQTIEIVGTDPTLCTAPGGLVVKGRGGNHQIDAIADFIMQAPFTHPQRLLVEAKCHSNPIGINKLREAVGVLKDVSEYWVTRSGIPRLRYHYNYAYFSASGYSSDAERYAFAQDIYLIPLANSKYLAPITNAIGAIGNRDFGAGRGWAEINISQSTLRTSVRKSLKNNDDFTIPEDWIGYEPAVIKLRQFIHATQRINFAMIAVLEGGLQLFLVPARGVSLDQLESRIQVRIFWDTEGWYIQRLDGTNLFSFDLPEELVKLYAVEDNLQRNRALDLKEKYLNEIKAVYWVEGAVRIITFSLDMDWLNYLRNRLDR